MERLDVRVPDAAARDAELPRHDARANLSRGGRAPDRIRPRPKGPLGGVGVGVQQDRRPVELPVPGLWRAGSRLQAWSGRRSRDRALRERHGPHDRPAAGLPQPPATRRGTTSGTLWILRSGRLYAVAAASWTQRGDREVLYGSPPGHGASLHRLCAPGPTDAAAIRVPAGVSRYQSPSAGAGAANTSDLSASSRGLCRRRSGRARWAEPSGVCHCAHAVARREVALEWNLPRGGDERWRGLQSMARRGGDPLARGSDPRSLGQLLLRSRPHGWPVLVGDPPAHARGRDQLRGRLLAGAGRVSPAGR